MGPEGGLVRVPRVGRRAGEERDENAAEGVDVRARRKRGVGGRGRSVARELLGRHVGRRAHRPQGQGGHAGGCGPLGEPEVGQVGDAAGVEADVRGRDVAVDDAAGVGHVERVGDRGEEGDDLRRGQRAAGPDDLGKVGPVEEPHRQVQLPLPLPGGMHGHDVGVLEGGEGVDLAEEPLAIRRVGGEGRGDQLEGDAPAGPLLGGQVDDAHPAPGEDGVDLVAGEDAAGGERRDHEASCDPPSGSPAEYRTAWGSGTAPDAPSALASDDERDDEGAGSASRLPWRRSLRTVRRAARSRAG